MLHDALLAPWPTLKTDKLSPKRHSDQGCKSRLHSMISIIFFFPSEVPQTVMNLSPLQRTQFQGLSFTSPGQRKRTHLLLVSLWHPNSLQWGQNHHPPGGHQKMLKKTKCYPWQWGGPFPTTTSTSASPDPRKDYSLRFLFLWPTSSSESPESLPSSSSPSSSSSSSLIKPFKLPCSSWSSRFSSSSSSSGKHVCLRHGDQGTGWMVVQGHLFNYNYSSTLTLMTQVPH